MRTVDLATLPPELRDLLADVQHERVMVTDQGQPVAVIEGLRDGDESLELDTDFWAEMERRRDGSGTVPLDEVLDDLRREEG